MLFGLTRDFVQLEGFRMVLGRSGGLPAEELNPVEVRMLGSKEIAHHLPFYLKEIDFNATLEYSLCGAKMLSSLMKSGKMGLTEFYALLLQIAEALEEGILHMLRPEQYALHEDYIFVDGELGTGRVYLTYIPLRRNPGEGELAERVLRLTSSLLKGITELRGDGIQRILHYSGSEEFTINGWKVLLSALLSGESGLPGLLREKQEPLLSEGTMRTISPLPAQEAEKRASPAEPTDWLKGYPLFGTGESAAAGEQTAGWSMGRMGRKGRENEFSRKEESAEGEEGDNAGRRQSGNRPFWIAGCVLADLLLWRYGYLNHPGRAALAAAGAGTLALGFLAWAAWRGGQGEAEPGGKADSEPYEAEGLTLKPQASLPTKPSARPVASLQVDCDPSDLTIGLTSGLTGEILKERPARLDEPATTLLVREPEGRKRDENRFQPFLERTREGTDGVEVIPLNRGSFIIGRSREAAQYMEDTEGASRVHAELSRSGGTYVLKDLDSRNGTRLGDEPLIPYKEYPLQEGDVFTIAGGRYLFRAGQALDFR
ncbi:DUF6382 domain-containing protein [Paenibacillus glufosinatiresistens]|uniref:DUF6382 domain-containing protein n=1 Tax=Paenibacillus glufosinatiresistens TaxID=3070657 RepID=UPI00286E9194|nr:DUF6382 domain-containing protein [Paenibacillus sp. YX.27]